MSPWRSYSVSQPSPMTHRKSGGWRPVRNQETGPVTRLPGSFDKPEEPKPKDFEKPKPW